MQPTKPFNCCFNISCQQRDIAAKDFNQLEGLIHPIRIAPEDILRCIIEWACLMTTRVSWTQPITQVCQQWRRIAVETPSLWTWISPPLNEDPNSVSEYWKIAAQRVKSVPANVQLFSITIYEPVSDVLQSCPLNKIQKISSLTIWIDKQFFEQLLIWLPTQEQTVGRLTIHNKFEVGGTSTVLFKDISTITSALSPVVLELDALNIGASATQHALPTVRKLSLSLIGGNFDLHELFQAFIFLEILKVASYQTQQNGSSRITNLKYLRHMEVEDHGFPWGLKLRCPILESVKIAGIGITPDTCEFLVNNGSIQKLVVSVEETRLYYLEEVSTAASKMDQLMRAMNASRSGIAKVLILRVQLRHGSDGKNLDSHPGLKGVSQSLATDEYNNPFKDYVWK